MLIESVAELDRRRDQWQALAAHAGTPLLDFDWVRTGAVTLHQGHRLCIRTAMHGGALSAAAPLVSDPARKRLVFVGSAHLFEPADWLFASRPALETLVDTVIAGGEPCALERIPRDGAVAHAIMARRGIRALTIQRPSAASHYVAMNGSWSAYVESLSARTRRALERSLVQLQRASGDVSLEAVSPGPSEVPEILETFAGLERSGWKGRGGSALTDRPDLLRFFREYTTRVASLGQLRVTRLRTAGQVAAMEIAVEAYGRTWGLKIAYAEPLAAHAPALLVIHESIRSSFERGLAGYEFLGSAEPWQLRWRPARREHGLLALYPRSVTGIARLTADAWGMLRVRAGRLRPSATTEVQGRETQESAR